MCIAGRSNQNQDKKYSVGHKLQSRHFYESSFTNMKTTIFSYEESSIQYDSERCDSSSCEGSQSDFSLSSSKSSLSRSCFVEVHNFHLGITQQVSTNRRGGRLTFATSVNDLSRAGSSRPVQGDCCPRRPRRSKDLAWIYPFLNIHRSALARIHSSLAILRDDNTSVMNSRAAWVYYFISERHHRLQFE